MLVTSTQKQSVHLHTVGHSKQPSLKSVAKRHYWIKVAAIVRHRLLGDERKFTILAASADLFTEVFIAGYRSSLEDRLFLSLVINYIK